MKNLWKKSGWIIATILGSVLFALGFSLFLEPNSINTGGISGLAQTLAHLLGIQNVGVLSIALNVPLFLFGLKKQGIVFTVYSIWAVFVYSAASYVITNVLPVDVTSASPFAGQDLLLCALFGGLISGIGSGMTIRFGGAIDGVEVMAVIFAKRLGLTVGTFVMIYNVLLYIVIGCVFRSWVLPLYSIVTYCVAIKAVDFIVEGLDKAKSAMIVTSRANEISEALSEAFGRGITHIGAKGYYSGADRTIIYFVVNRFQIGRLKAIVTELDPDAFLTISEVSDVLGRSVQK